MKTAEEILRSNVSKDCIWEDMNNLTNTPIRDVVKAMEEYAEQRVEEATMKMKEAVRVAMHDGVIKYGVRVRASANDICSIIDQHSKAPTV